MRGGIVESERVLEFVCERDERMKIIGNACISEVDKIIMKGGTSKSGREFQNLTVKEMKE